MVMLILSCEARQGKASDHSELNIWVVLFNGSLEAGNFIGWHKLMRDFEDLLYLVLSLLKLDFLVHILYLGLDSGLVCCDLIANFKSVVFGQAAVLQLLSQL